MSLFVASRRPAVLCLQASLILVLAACKPGSNQADGGSVPDTCTTVQDALSSSACVLSTDGTLLNDYIGHANDQHWYRIQLPGNLDARSLVHVVAGYSAPGTPVSLTVNVVRSGSTASLASGVDNHGAGAPKPVDLLFQDSRSSDVLLVNVADANLIPTRPAFDVHAQYSIKAEMRVDPDVNELNNPNPTPITLTSSGAASSGSQSGYLSIPGDVDTFSVAVPAQSAPAKLLYVHITAPASQLSPPASYALSYDIKDPSGNLVFTDAVSNQFTDVDLAVSIRTISSGGQYQIVIPHVDPQNPAPNPGDIRLQYSLAVKLMDEVDANEPNDTIDTAKVVTLSSVNTSKTVTGRLEEVADQDHLGASEDWFEVDLPTNSSHTLLHYKLTSGSNSPRFQPFMVHSSVPVVGPPTPNRQLQAFSQVSSANSCNTDPVVCPKGDEGNPVLVAMEAQYCALSTPRCIWAERDEDVNYSNLKNFEGIIPVAAHPGGTLKYFFLVHAAQGNYADDLDYNLTWTLESDPSVYASGFTKPIQVIQSITVTNSTASFPSPPPGATTLIGELLYGFGHMNQYQWSKGDGIRGPNDFDAVVTDSDTYELDIPSPPAADQTWELQWSVAHNGSNQYVYDLGVEVTFCDHSNTADGGTGVCVPYTMVNTPGAALAYQPGNLQGWPSVRPPSGYQPLWTRDSNDLVTATAYSCNCLQSRYVQSGKFFLKIVAVDRASYAPVQYTLNTALIPYPQSYMAGGSSVSCPAQCLFTVQ